MTTNVKKPVRAEQIAEKTTAHNIILKRSGNIVTASFDTAWPTKEVSVTEVFTGEIPVGFRPTTIQYAPIMPRSSLFYGGALNVATNGNVSYANNILTGNVVYSGSLTWITKDAWPV